MGYVEIKVVLHRAHETNIRQAGIAEHLQQKDGSHRASVRKYSFNDGLGPIHTQEQEESEHPVAFILHGS